jgi:uncharacterized repeat protein (TIGR03803 family)
VKFQLYALVLLALALPSPAPGQAAAGPGTAGAKDGPVQPERGRLLLYTDGNFYGVSSGGGAHGLGTLYRITPAGEVTVMVHFNDNAAPAKGQHPAGALISDGAGNLWGTTTDGGKNDGGTVFKVDATTWKLSTLMEFGFYEKDPGMVPGNSPYVGLTSDGAGYFWGVTYGGGAGGAGTIFKVKAATGGHTLVHEFRKPNGETKLPTPLAGLVADGQGFLWGSTMYGGLGFGTLFKISVATGELATVTNFTGRGTAAKGQAPYSELEPDGLGFFWGTTMDGGEHSKGTIYKVDQATGKFISILDFTGRAFAPLGSGGNALTNDGTFFMWGTSPRGGNKDLGTIFKVNKGNGVLTTVAEFTGDQGPVRGRYPSAPLVSDGKGSLWGTTPVGGGGDGGTVFKINTTSGAFTTMAEFSVPPPTPPAPPPKRKAKKK